MKWTDERRLSERLETSWMLLAPTVATALLVAAVGLLADAPFSPLEWVKLIVAREYK